MENYVIAALALGAMFLALALGMPIGFAMGLAGTLGVVAIIGFEPGMALLGQTAYEEVITQSLSVVPLFVLMGFFATQSGLSAGLYRTAAAVSRSPPSAPAAPSPRSAARASPPRRR